MFRIRVLPLLLAAAVLLSCPLFALADDPAQKSPPASSSVPETALPVPPTDVETVAPPVDVETVAPPTDVETVAPPADVETDKVADLSGILVTLEHRGGWKVMVSFPPEARVGVERIRPEFSFDEAEFLPAHTGNGDDVVWDEVADCAPDEVYTKYLSTSSEPLKSFIERKYDRFYLRFQLEGAQAGCTEVYLVERTLAPQPIPAEWIVISSLPAAMEVKTMRPPSQRGLYNVTARAGDSAETLSSYLPDTLQLNVQLQVPNPDAPHPGAPDFAGQGDMPFGVDWVFPAAALTSEVVKNGVVITPPTDEMILQTEAATYTISEVPPVQIIASDPDNPGEFIWVDEPFDLAINVIPADEKFAPQFGVHWQNKFEEHMLTFSLPYKPTGAHSIVAEYSHNGGKSWQTVDRAGGNDLVELGFAPDMVPTQADYAAPVFFDNDKSPMKEYLADKSKGFLVRLQIDGGVYDGVSDAFPFPGDYKFDPPTTISPGTGDNGGNRGDVGSDDDGGSASVGGQRPQLPEVAVSTAEATDGAVPPLLTPPIVLPTLPPELSVFAAADEMSDGDRDGDDEGDGDNRNEGDADVPMAAVAGGGAVVLASVLAVSNPSWASGLVRALRTALRK